MTFCAGLRVRDGLIGIADTRVTTSTEHIVARKAGYLAFDATRASAVDADFPIDIVIYKKDSKQISEYRFARNDLIELSTWWQKYVSQAVEELPAECFDKVFSDLPRE